MRIEAARQPIGLSSNHVSGTDALNVPTANVRMPAWMIAMKL